MLLSILSAIRSIAYYLCDYAGSAKVMANMITIDELDLGCSGIEKVLALLLQDKDDDNSLTELDPEASYSHYLAQIIEAYNTWFQQHKTAELGFIKEFRSLIYSQGSPRELLLTDALLAILLMKIERSAFNLLPKYSGLPRHDWQGMLQNKKNIHELGLPKYVWVRPVFSLENRQSFKCLQVPAKQHLFLLLYELPFLQKELVWLLLLRLLGHYAAR